MTTRLQSILVLFPMLLAVSSLASDNGYQTQTVEGWTVHVSERLMTEQKHATTNSIELLTVHLKGIVRVVPAAAVAQLRRIPLWLSAPYCDGRGARAEYHPDEHWLRRNGRNPAMVKSVEITNVAIFEEETRRMPMFVLHELAHAYHDQVVGFGNDEVKAAYRRAVESKSYDAVKNHLGRVMRAYAMTDEKEYFAENSEAFFGQNDFYPFTRAELKEHDPAMYTLLEHLWGCDQVAARKPVVETTELAGGLKFTEGPAVDKAGNLFFSDVHASRTYKRSPDGKVSVFRENTASANGLAFDRDGNLLVCEGGNGRVVAIDTLGRVSVVADKYRGKRFNQPNDLWIAPGGGVYFTDPVYGRGERPQGGEHVYYVAPDRERVFRVIDDMIRPNGIVGTPDGQTLYVADHGSGRIFRYRVNDDGSLRDKTLFVAHGSDGMKLDATGNLYITTDAVLVFDRAGKQVGRIDVPQRPTNLCFAGTNSIMLFVTAGSAVYAAETKKW